MYKVRRFSNEKDPLSFRIGSKLNAKSKIPRHLFSSAVGYGLGSTLLPSVPRRVGGVIGGVAGGLSSVAMKKFKDLV